TLPTRTQVVQGSRDQFFSGSGLTANQDGCIGRRYRLNFLEHPFERFAVADDLIEVVFRPNLFFEIKLFLRKLVSQIDDLSETEGVLNRNRNLICHRLQEIGVGLRKNGFSTARHSKRPEKPAMRDQRHVTARLKSFSQHASCEFGIDLLNVRPGQEQGFSFRKCKARWSIFRSNRETFLKKACCALKIERVDLKGVAVR